MISSEHSAAFDAARPMLTGLAYRILGTLADAEDAVQDTYLKWLKTDRDGIDNPSAWLSTACTRRCLDLLRAANRARVDYVGSWLPEPVPTPLAGDADRSAEQNVELASSLRMAFLMMLDRLSPRERAAYLLREVFEMDYGAVAETLEISEPACRQLVSRAKRHVADAKVRHATAEATQNRLLAAFQDAVNSGATDRLEGLLAGDIRFHSDHGGKAEAASRVLAGLAEVTGFIAKGLHRFWDGKTWVASVINGQKGFVLKDADGPHAAVSFAYGPDGRITDIYVTRNPDKLTRLDAAAVH